MSIFINPVGKAIVKAFKSKGIDIQGSSSKIPLGTEIELGRGYKAVNRNTTEGRRFVITDANGNRLPNVPVHHYLKDADKYYRQWLDHEQETPNISTPDDIEQEAKEAHKSANQANDKLIEILEAEKEQKAKDALILEYAEAEAYRWNEEHPDDIVTSNDVRKFWEENPKDAPPPVQELMGYTPVDEENEEEGPEESSEETIPNEAPEEEGMIGTIGNSLWDAVKGIGDMFGGSEEQQPSANPYDRKNPLAQADLEVPKSYQKSSGYRPDLDPNKARLPNKNYLDVMNQGMRAKYKQDFVSSLQSNQQKRAEEIWNLGQRLNAQEKDPESSFRERQQNDLDRYKTGSFNQGDILSQSMPQKPIDFRWDDMPTFEKTRDLYNELRGNDPVYESSKPFDRRLHNLAIAGHAPGSSSIENTEENKRGAMRSEDLRNLSLMHNMLLDEHRAKGNTVDYINRLGEGYRSAYENPLKSESDIMGASYNRKNDRDYRNNVLDKDISQMMVADYDDRISEGADLYNLLENDRMRANQERQNQNDQIKQLEFASINGTLNKAIMSGEMAQLRQNLWANRNQIELALRQQLNAEQQQELKDTRGKEEFVAKLVELLGKGAITIASMYAGGPAGAGIAMGVTEALSGFGAKNKSGIGQSATTGVMK